MTDQKSPEGIASPSIPPDRDLYTIPSHSSWFRWEEIHDTERRELGEFFDGSSFSRNPRVYKEYRDFIINKYREDPSRRITFTDVRRSLVGDAGSLHCVFLFLDRWGLINFSAAPGGRKRDGGGYGGDGGGFPVVVEDGPPGGIKVAPYPNAPRGAPAPAPAKKGVGGGFRLPPLTSYLDVFGNRVPFTTGRVCGFCGVQCVSGYSESKKDGVVICTKCFNDKNYGENKSADDFNFKDQINGGGKHVTNEWTDVETLHLLEAIVSKGPDWDLIANHVGRSRLDCIAKLIQLPFGEHMLGSITNKHDHRNSTNQRSDEPPRHASTDMDQVSINQGVQCNENANGKEQIADEGKVGPTLKRRWSDSLADANDSLMEQVALLSAIVGPHVAAATTEAVIKALCEENPYAKKVFKIDDGKINGKAFTFATNNKLACDIKVEGFKSEEQSNVAERLESTPVQNFGHSAFHIRAATATAFGAAAARAKLLADQEDREIEHLMATIIDMQLRKIHYKTKHFEDLESIMEKQYTEIQQLKESILAEWIAISQQALVAGIPRWKDHGFSERPLPSSSSLNVGASHFSSS